MRRDGRGSSAGSSTRSMLGTYEYMSPEQKRGEDATAQSDLYSVGLMAFKLLTGQNPGLKPPSRINPELSSKWDDLLERALEESPASRWPSAAEMREALEGITSGLEQSARKAEESRVEVEKVIPCSSGALSPETEDPDILRRQSAGATGLGRAGATEFGRGFNTEFGRGVATGKSGGKGWVWALFITLGLLGAVFYANRDSRPATTTQTPSPPVVQPPRATTPTTSTPTPVTRTPTPAPSQPAVTPPARRNPIEGQNWTSPATGMEFVWIPAMNLWVGKFEVTNGEYRKKDSSHDSGKYRNHNLNGERQPVVRVNFNEAKAYAEWLTQQDRAVLGGVRYRLPSEQEWRTFTQCGDGREYPWGNNWPPRSGQAGNYHGQEGAGTWSKISGYNDGFLVTAPVDRLWRNPWGLHGVGGNVWEACARDSSGGSFGAWRGASWSNYYRGNLRVSIRNVSGGSTRDSNRGFRLLFARP